MVSVYPGSGGTTTSGCGGTVGEGVGESAETVRPGKTVSTTTNNPTCSHFCLAEITCVAVALCVVVVVLNAYTLLEVYSA